MGGNHEAQDRYFNCDIKTYLSEVITFGLVEECSECKLGESSELWEYERQSLPTFRDTIYSQRFIFNGGAAIGHIYNSRFYIKFETPSRAVQDFVESQLEDFYEGEFN